MLNIIMKEYIMKTNIKALTILIVLFVAFSISVVQAQKPYRAGTTTANFLEIGYGSAGIAMGDAYVSMAKDISAIYWNPAGLGFMETNEFQGMYQPWIADINTSYMGVGYVVPGIGTFAAGLIYVGYGEEEVTSMLMQEGTGEKFDGLDFSFSLSYGRKIAQFFSFGASVKYIASRIWHEDASAFAVDLGAIVSTSFLSWTGEADGGLSIGMSISNYGTRMQYDGIDLKRPIDEEPDEAGNFAYVPARFETQSWELPLIFRIGASAHPIYTARHRFTVSVDALHPNNNSEHINVGGEYAFTLPGFGVLSLRGGYKGVEMIDSEYGMTFGFGLLFYYLNNNALKIDYAYRNVGVLGNWHAYTFSITF
jgi:hypothetical protein